MITLTRQEALTLLSLHYLLSLTDNERENILLDMVEDFDESEVAAAAYNEHILAYYKEISIGVKNIFLEREIERVVRAAVKVEGEEENLYKCPCCGFKTLKTKGEYEICRVCKWEDDGNTDPGHYSSVNRKTLEEAINIFNEQRKAHPAEKKYGIFNE
ncbi:MAG TPA: CPCC family cysteine-rich protein [Chitinophaga sp.]|uniref:CPCC family cysteine-rich protein n=1 Tax=Chitinophaga sp. TaxID=1869181 RepID=UPI002DBAD9DF|nr:CPCC family cysteine-rich protein [Chitinophaga sp.]HEU4553069.1 CPCC family cysteine-rich protein [Chitinophaga sp.]